MVTSDDLASILDSVDNEAIMPPLVEGRGSNIDEHCSGCLLAEDTANGECSNTTDFLLGGSNAGQEPLGSDLAKHRADDTRNPSFNSLGPIAHYMCQMSMFSSRQ